VGEGIIRLHQRTKGAKSTLELVSQNLSGGEDPFSRFSKGVEGKREGRGRSSRQQKREGAVLMVPEEGKERKCLGRSFYLGHFLKKERKKGRASLIFAAKRKERGQERGGGDVTAQRRR